MKSKLIHQFAVGSMNETILTKRQELVAALITHGIRADLATRSAADLLGGVLVTNVRRHGALKSHLVPLAQLCGHGPRYKANQALKIQS